VKNPFYLAAITAVCIAAAACVSAPPAKGAAPSWVQNLEQAYPSREWAAVTGQGASRDQAESAAMNALARMFKTDVASLTSATRQFSQIVTEAAGKKSVTFDESSGFAEEVSTASNVRGLIGVQIEVYTAPDNTVYANARMNRAESAARYAGMVRENSAVIASLLRQAASAGVGFEGYAALSFAAAVATVTDNFQNILEVLDPAAASRRPAYGGAGAIRTRMLEMAGKITVGLVVRTADRQDTTLIRRALGSFFTDRGFKVNEQGTGNYILRADARFEPLSQQRLETCRYYFEAALERRDGRAIFAFTTDDRMSHLQASEAKRLAVRAVEVSVKEGAFVEDFEKWLNVLLD
jgi:hypothetical protein